MDATGTQNDLIHSLLLQTDGRYLAIGRGYFYNYDFALARYRSDGSLDTSFHSDGKTNTEIWDNGDFARGGALQTDGKVVAAGYTWWLGQYNVAVARYETSGELDTSFHTDGKATLVLSASDNGALGVRISTEGSIALVGTAHNGLNWDFAFARYKSDGSLDTAFSTDGRATIAVAASDEKAYAIQISTSGTILAGGYASVNDLDYALVRVLTSGELDTAFHTDGKLTHSIYAAVGDDDVVGALLFQADEAILAGGYSETGNNNDFSMARYLTDGTLDTSFNTSGKIIRSIGSNEDTGHVLAIQTNGQIFLGGTSSNGGNTDFAIARLATNGATSSSGSVDFSFGTEGVKVDSIGTTDAARSVILQTDGRVMTYGNSNIDFVAIRYHETGALDTSFHTDGIATFHISADVGSDIILQTDGRWIGVGYTGTDAGLIRYDSSGILDSSFHTDGKLTLDISGTDEAYAGVIQTDGKIVFGGYSTGSGAVAHIGRFLTDGTIDTTFATTGVALLDLGTGAESFYELLVDTDGSILGTGRENTANLLVARYLTDGSLDTAFHTDGSYAPTVNQKGTALAFDKDPSKAIVLHNHGGIGGITRFMHDGSLDTSFDTDGKGDTSSTTLKRTGQNLLVLESGEILAPGWDSATDFLIARYRTNGTFDTSFDTDGTVSKNISGNDEAYAIVRISDGRVCAVGRVNNLVDFGIVCFLQ